MLKMTYTENGKPSGQLSFSRAPLLKRESNLPVAVSVMPALHAGCVRVVNFIRATYELTYGSDIGVHYPKLMSVHDGNDTLLAALGFRPADHERLFLEQYLDEPIERMLGMDRKHIVEVGSLAALSGGASVFLYAALIGYLQHYNFSHVVLTATNSLEKRLRVMGWDLQRLAPADPARLKPQGDDWGTYYDTNPNVVVGDVDEAYAKLQTQFGAEYIAHPEMFARIYYNLMR